MITLGELASVLAESEYDYRQLEEIYSSWLNRMENLGTQQTDRFMDESFDTPPAADLCRTYHVWTLENKPRYRCVDIMDTDDPIYRIELSDLPVIKRENEDRMRMGMSQGLPPEEIPLIEYTYIIDQYWHFQMLSPDGRVLTEYDTPYEYKSHPYIYKLHYLVNGRTVPFISVIIDQQRYINRLIMLNDLAIQSAVKGVKMIPKDSVPDGMSNREFAEQFVEIQEREQTGSHNIELYQYRYHGAIAITIEFHKRYNVRVGSLARENPVGINSGKQICHGNTELHYIYRYVTNQVLHVRGRDRS